MNFDSIFLFNLTAISAYFQPVDIDISLKNFTTFLNDYIFMVKEFGETISVQFTSPIKFTELQTVLLTVFLVIFSVNLALIGFYWNKYGGVITDRFIRQSECLFCNLFH